MLILLITSCKLEETDIKTIIDAFFDNCLFEFPHEKLMFEEFSHQGKTHDLDLVESERLLSFSTFPYIFNGRYYLNDTFQGRLDFFEHLQTDAWITLLEIWQNDK